MQDILSNKRMLEELLPKTQILYYLSGGDGGAPSWIRGSMGQIRAVSEELWGICSFDLPFGLLRVKVSKSFNPGKKKSLGGWAFLDEERNKSFFQPEAKLPPKKRSRKQEDREAFPSLTMDDTEPKDASTLSFYTRRADPRGSIVLLSCDIAKDVELLKEQLRDRRACPELFHSPWQRR